MSERIKFKTLLIDLMLLQNKVTTYRIRGHKDEEDKAIKNRDKLANIILGHTNRLQNHIEVLESTISDVY
jgi:hypothetical protein